MSLFRIFSFFLFLACLLAAALFPVRSGAAAELAREEAQKVLEDTFVIAGYTDLRGEKDFSSSPENVIRAALFGAFDAKMSYAYEQQRLKEEGKAPMPASRPLFAVNGRALEPDQVLDRDEAPTLFKNLPQEYNVFISRKAVELAALRYTGHAVGKHLAPVGEGFLGDTLLKEKGYFVRIDGLGDLIVEPKLKTITSRGEGFVLAGDLAEPMEDDQGSKPGAFSLELIPGDVPGTWKREYEERPGK